MKVCLITDTHFGIKNDSILFHDYQKKFLDNIFFPELERRNITRIIHLGDLADRRKTISFNTWQFLQENFLERTRKYNLDIILGNHDVYYKNTNKLNSPELLFKDYSNINIYSKATEIEDINALYIPWINAENYEETMEAIKNTTKPLAFGHLEVNGYVMFKGAICDKGMTPEIYSSFDMVFSGHFHTKNSNGNIHYLGCPWDLIFTDSEDLKGIHFFDTETYELEFVANPYKIFNRLYYNDTGAKKVKDVLLSDEFYENLKNTFVKVYIKSKNNPVFFNRYCDRLNESSPNSIIYIEEKVDVSLSDENVSLTEDTLSIIRNSLDDYSDIIPNENKKKELENLITELYVEALKDEN